MKNRMVRARHIARKLWDWANCEALVGLTIFLAGAYIATEGVLEIQKLWKLFSGFFPLQLPEDASERILTFLPALTGMFVTTVSSIAAVLMGAAWVVSGLGEFFQPRRRAIEVPDFHRSELVAEAVRTGRATYWKSASLLLRTLASRWRRARFISPVSQELLRDLWRSLWKIVCAGLVIYGVCYLLEVLPILLKRYLNLQFALVVPSPRPLILLLVFVVLVYAMIAVSLMPFKRPQLRRGGELLPVRGLGDPQAFFALLEEGCTLLSPPGAPHRMPIRLEQTQFPEIRATLVETSPQVMPIVARPASYFCLPLVFLMMTMGFSRLVHFQRPAGTMPYREFFSTAFLTYCLEIAFAVGLIVVGLHFASKARRLFGTRRYRSALVFAHVSHDAATESAKESRVHNREESDWWQWKSVKGADERFAEWVRAPRLTKTFRALVFWAEAISETTTTDGPRFLIDLRKSPSLDAAMAHIVNVPFHVSFEMDPSYLQSVPDETEPDLP